MIDECMKIDARREPEKSSRMGVNNVRIVLEGITKDLYFAEEHDGSDISY